MNLLEEIGMLVPKKRDSRRSTVLKGSRFVFVLSFKASWTENSVSSGIKYERLALSSKSRVDSAVVEDISFRGRAKERSTASYASRVFGCSSIS